MNIINSTKQSYTAFTTSPAAQAWAADFSLLSTDSVRVLNATSVAAMRTTALTMRFTSITIESLNVGLGYALDNTPKTYEETRESMSSLMDNLMDMFDDAEEAKPEAKSVA
jgi:hypothetical protein